MPCLAEGPCYKKCKQIGIGLKELRNLLKHFCVLQVIYTTPGTKIYVDKHFSVYICSYQGSIFRKLEDAKLRLGCT